MRPSPERRPPATTPHGRSLAPLPRTLAALLLTGSLGACSTFGLGGARPGATPDDAPTIKTLLSREVVIDDDPGIPADEDKAIAAYRNFLAITPDARQRAQALRRLGDLSMASADNANAATPTASGTPDYSAAIAQYRDYLKNYPDDPDNDRVLYQLARAQEQGGQLEESLRTLDQLVAKYPNTHYRDEIEFRRGEILFTLRQYPKAEAAYTLVLGGDFDNPYRHRALYMQGWSRFKQGNLDDALTSFFDVLDGKIVGIRDDDLDKSDKLSRADKASTKSCRAPVPLSNARSFSSAPVPKTSLIFSSSSRVTANCALAISLSFASFFSANARLVKIPATSNREISFSTSNASNRARSSGERFSAAKTGA